MVSSNATTVEQYLAELPDDRRADVARVREVILANLPDGLKETMQYGMIAYAIPLERFPNTYNGQALVSVALAAQKRHISVYLHGLYASPELTDWFLAAYAESGKKLNMGKSCVRFRRADDAALDVIGEIVARVTPDDLIAAHEAVHSPEAKQAQRAARAKQRAS
ncbi:MAG: DUF1801 domain-containing protein [Chloroflexota bacterium]|nr:DUF1801 domain-containing protein [Chloroflexota bacterium]